MQWTQRATESSGLAAADIRQPRREVECTDFLRQSGGADCRAIACELHADERCHE